MSDIITAYLYTWRKTLTNFKTYIVLVLAIIALLIVTNPIVAFLQKNSISINLLEVIILALSQEHLLVIYSVLCILLINDAPFIDVSDSYYLLRISKSKYAFGQVLYVISVVVLFYSILFFASITPFTQYGYLENKWSEATHLLATTDAAIVENISLTYSNAIMWKLDLYTVFRNTILLLLLSNAFLCLLFSYVTLIIKKNVAFIPVLALFAVGKIIQWTAPDLNRLSILIQMNFVSHNFGRVFHFPTMIESVIVFSVGIAFLSVMIIWKFHKMDMIKIEKL